MTTRDDRGSSNMRGNDPYAHDPFETALGMDNRGGRGHQPPSPRGGQQQWSSGDPGFIGLVSDDPAGAQAQMPRGGARPDPRAYQDPRSQQDPRGHHDPRGYQDTRGSDAGYASQHRSPSHDYDRRPPSADLAEGTGVREADQPIPRIRIHAACDRRDVARMIQVSAGDRRMEKAQVSIELGGVEAAMARLAAEPSPDLLILDTVVYGAELLRALERLSEVVEPKCKVMIIGATNDIMLYRKLMQLGVSEYLVAPMEPVQFIRSIGQLYADPDKPFAGRVTAVMGARGGVGASSIAHNIAWAISEQQSAHVSLVDLDLPFGTAAMDFNEDPQQSIMDALAAFEKVDEMFLDRVVTRPTERLQLFTAPARIEKGMDLDAAAVAAVLEKVRRTGPNIILDLPHVWTSWMHQTVLSADDIVIVASPDLSSLRNAKNLVEFAVRARPQDPLPMIVLNMVGIPKRPEISAKDFSENVGAPVVAEIPFDPATFGAAVNSGHMLMEAGAASKAAQVISQLATRLTGRTVQAPKRAGILNKIGLNRR